MTPDAIKELKASYAEVTATQRQLASRFYQELFSVAPNLRHLFPKDLTELQGHFEAALALVIWNLDEMEKSSCSARTGTAPRSRASKSRSATSSASISGAIQSTSRSTSRARRAARSTATLRCRTAARRV
jgi:hypothetical protein